MDERRLQLARLSRLYGMLVMIIELDEIEISDQMVAIDRLIDALGLINELLAIPESIESTNLGASISAEGISVHTPAPQLSVVVNANTDTPELDNRIKRLLDVQDALLFERLKTSHP